MAQNHNQNKLATLQPTSGSFQNIWRQPFSNIENFEHNQYLQTIALV